MKTKVRYYNDFTDDFSVTKNQNRVLPDSYEFIKTGFFSRLLAAVVYGIALIVSFLYLKLFLHLSFSGREKFKSVKGGFFIYGNHTQSFGDVFIPALAAFPRRIYTVASTANYGIPVVGKLLRPLGALPVIPTLKGMRNLEAAIKERAENGHPVVIFPEAHVWDYYTGIRPFADTSFKYPVKLNMPALSITSTYRKSRFFKRPIIKVMVEGPFYPEGETPRQRAADLHKKVYAAMVSASKQSNTEYIAYKKSG